MIQLKGQHVPAYAKVYGIGTYLDLNCSGVGHCGSIRQGTQCALLRAAFRRDDV